ncbi:MAG: hypothetical protein ACK4NC_01600 [Candidatus Gracilibacteria bacterium]
MKNLHLQYHAININHHSAEELHESFHINVGEEGELFIAVGFTNIVNEVGCKNTLYTIVQTIQNTLFSDTSKDLYERFEEGIKELNIYLQDKDFTEIGRTHIAIGLLENDSMYITKTGGAEIYLLRSGICTNVTANFDNVMYSEDEDNQLSSIASGEEGLPEYFTNIATGALEEKDIILISSTRFTKFIGEQEVLALFGKNNIEIGFINMEHKLKENPSADIAVLGFIYTGGDAKTMHESSTSTTYAEDGSMYVPSREANKIDIKKIFTSIAQGKVNWDSIKTRAKDFYEQQKLYVMNPKYRVKLIILGIVLLLILLVVNISTAIGGKQNAEQTAALQQKFAEAQKEYQLGATSNIKGDREAARTHLDTAKKLTLELKEGKKSTADMNALLDKIEKEEDEANKLTRIGEANSFIDLNGKVENDDPKGLAYFDEKVYAYSSTSLYGPFVNNTTNANSKYAVEDNNLIKDVAYFGDIRGLLIKLTPDKVAEFVNNDFKYSDTTSTTWKSGDTIATFGNNLYLLSENQVWRYTRNKNTYRGPSPWLQKTDPILKDAVSFSIDGSIYVLLKTGEIKKYFQGKPVTDFVIQDMPKDLLQGVDDRSQILTTADATHVYVLNHGTGKIIVLTKVKGNVSQVAFDKQFGFDQVEIIHIVLSADEKTLLALGNNKKIYKIDL